MNTAKQHQLRIARQTVRMHPAMIGVMGGMSLVEALNFLRVHGNAVERRESEAALGRQS
jgi:hypothetical protein